MVFTELVFLKKEEEKKRGRLRFSLGIEEALGEILAHQRFYPILITIMCNDYKFNSSCENSMNLNCCT